jgi:acetyl esterase/lipase
MDNRRGFYDNSHRRRISAAFQRILMRLIVPSMGRNDAGSRLSGQDVRPPRISLLHGAMTGLPPLLIQAGGDEMLLSGSIRLAERARAAGVDVTLDIWPRMWHVWQLLAPMLPEASQAIDALGAFIRKHLKPARP